MSTQSCFVEVDLPFYRKLVIDKLENNKLECDLKNLEECLKLICTLEAEGRCLDLCLRLYAALRRKCNNCNIFLAIVKPKILRTIDHHAFLLILENEITVIDPMSFCAKSLPWKWLLRFRDIMDLEDKLNVDVIILFNETKSLIKITNQYNGII